MYIMLNSISKTVAYATSVGVTRHISCHLRQMLCHSHEFHGLTLRLNFSQDHECQEDNQEYWSGHYYDSYSQEYPEDWVKRTQSTPHRHKFPRTAY